MICYVCREPIGLADTPTHWMERPWIVTHDPSCTERVHELRRIVYDRSRRGRVRSWRAILPLLNWLAQAEGRR
jgi:hypothetical protein